MSERTDMSGFRWLAAVVVFAFFLFWSFFLASLMGFSTRPESVELVAEHWPLLVPSVVAGLLGVGGARLILQQRLLSWWLLLALPIPAVITLQQVGLL